MKNLTIISIFSLINTVVFLFVAILVFAERFLILQDLYNITKLSKIILHKKSTFLLTNPI